MKNKITMMAAAVAALVSFTASVQAVPITGGISLAGGVTPNTGDVTTAASFSFSGDFVTSVSGSFAVPHPAGSAVTINTFVLSPFAAQTPLWFFNATDSFDLLSIGSPDYTTPNTVAVTGSGMLHLFGYEDTVGTWVFTANQAGGTFSFSSSNGAVPDGGMTVLLLGAALTGLFLVRKQVLA